MVGATTTLDNFCGNRSYPVAITLSDTLGVWWMQGVQLRLADNDMLQFNSNGKTKVRVRVRVRVRSRLGLGLGSVLGLGLGLGLGQG